MEYPSEFKNKRYIQPGLFVKSDIKYLYNRPRIFNWVIHREGKIMRQLLKHGYKKFQKKLTLCQVMIIFKELGPPEMNFRNKSYIDLYVN
jgi:hypothetical protein